jgi:polysaccharide biosynthesis protein PslG
MLRRCIPMLTLLCLLLAAAPSAAAQGDQRCSPETNQCISGRIRQFWEQNGGLPVFGYPTGPQSEIQIEGKPFQAQLFERNRLELHPENQRPYDVLLGRLGADRLAQQGRDPFTFPKSDAQNGCRFFPETGHNVCGAVLNAWRANGLEFDGKKGKSEGENLALFGLPLSDVQTENIQGKDYQVQWFERARFELHPENAPPFDVLLGLLGNETSGGAPPP